MFRSDYIPFEGAFPYDLREQRNKLGLTQIDIARTCNISITTYQYWERGALQKISQENVRKLREVLG